MSRIITLIFALIASVFVLGYAVGKADAAGAKLTLTNTRPTLAQARKDVYRRFTVDLNDNARVGKCLPRPLKRADLCPAWFETTITDTAADINGVIEWVYDPQLVTIDTAGRLHIWTAPTHKSYITLPNQ